jgi:outer membrane protein
MLTAAVAALLGSAPAYAEVGDILVKGRGTYHNRLDGLTLTLPNGDEPVESGVEDTVGAEVSLTMFLTNRIAFEAALGSAGYQLRDPSGNKLVSANMLMSTATVQYHFAPDADVFRPYAGAGVTHLNIYGEGADVALLNFAPDPFASYSVRLTSGFAPVAQIGADIAVNDRIYLNIDAKFTSRKTEVLIEREAQTAASRRLDSLIIAAGVGFRF